MRLSSETKRRLRGIGEAWVAVLCFLAVCVTIYGLYALADFLWGRWGVAGACGVLVTICVTAAGYHAGRSA